MRVKKNYKLAALLLLLLVFSVSAFVGRGSGSVSVDHKAAATILDAPSSQEEMPKSVDEVIKWNTRVEQSGCDATLIVEVTQLDGWHIYSQILPEDGISIPTAFYFDENAAYQRVGKVQEPHTEVEDNGGIPERAFHGSKVVFKQKIKALSKNDFKIGLEVEFMACKTACFPPSYKNFEFNIKGCSGGSDVKVEEKQDTADETESVEEITDSAEAAETFAGPLDFKLLAYRTGAKEYKLQMDILIRDGWYLFAEDVEDIQAYYLNVKEEDGIKLKGDPVIPEAESVEVGGKKIKAYTGRVLFKQLITVEDTTNLPDALVHVTYHATNGDSLVHTVANVKMEFDLNKAPETIESNEKESYLGIFILAFIGGLLALLTPCVFPMIPLTVTFFTKQSKTRGEGLRKAFLYSISIIVIYVLLGVGVSGIFGAEALNELSTNVYMNIVFFLLFVIFAVSFFGAFEIRLPSSWINKSDKQADKGGLIGVFFMAFTLALVSFSCTGPIVGSVLVQSAEGGFMGPIVAMVGFSLALALPFGLFAAFPGWLNSLPQSGGWLNSVKVVLGFLELAFALKFLSNADLVTQAHLLEREVFIALWISIFLLMGIYLIGKIKFAHDSDVSYLSVPRSFFAIITFAFVAYLLPGMWGAPLKLLSGIAPALSYSESQYGVNGHAPEVDTEIELPPSAIVNSHGMIQIMDYNEGMDYARKVGKPVFIDFTGWACVNCRRMEEHVWTDERVSPIMKDDIIIVSLYVDEDISLPESEQYYSKVLDRKIVTTGQKWMEMEIGLYQEATQPLYVILDHSGNSLNGKANYQTHSDPEDFAEWLEQGVAKFKLVKDVQAITPKVELVSVN